MVRCSKGHFYNDRVRITPDNAQCLGGREEQQDAYACFDQTVKAVPHAGYVAIVADGMGGMRLGKEAAEAAVRAFLDAYAEKTEEETIPDALRRAVFRANASVLELADEHGVRGDAGTTLIAAVIQGDELYWISVGDSRIYRLDGQSITQLNKEHNLKSKLERLAAQGLVGEEEANAHLQRDALLSYIGIEELTEIDMSPAPMKLLPDCCILLCSDGLYRTLSGDEILSATWSSQPREIARNLVKAVMDKRKQHQDNVTAVTLTLHDENHQQTANDASAEQGQAYRGATVRPRGEELGKFFWDHSPKLLWLAAATLLILGIAALAALR
jgi:protein phosphatase